jgi:hypothetical protein
MTTDHLCNPKRNKQVIKGPYSKLAINVALGMARAWGSYFHFFQNATIKYVSCHQLVRVLGSLGFIQVYF